MNPFYKEHQSAISTFIKMALKEDIGSGDHTSLACLSDSTQAKARLLVKEEGIIAGVALAEIIFRQVNPSIQVQILKKDGESIAVGEDVFRIEGPQIDLLKTERLVLNCMQRMSGIATLTHRLKNMISHTKCELLDTRKTTPNFRYPEKWAVKIGGGQNHRMGLFDMIMIKDNHVDFNGTMKNTLEKTERYLNHINHAIKTVVEVRNLEEIEACLNFPWIHRLLLDNMEPNALKEALKCIGGKFQTEASGNITEDNISSIAETGVDYVSLGALTHSAKNIDLSLKSI